MKKLIVLSALFIGIISFGQTPPKKKQQKDIDKEANRVLDSLSKVYKVEVVSYLIETYNGMKNTSIAYVKNKELVYKVIKTEIVKKEDE
ncbi:MAG: hypothetical protein KA210_00125 [Bacteroidia bacterium]|nr:hypothetical protein [Bacteroidia bacterium]